MGGSLYTLSMQGTALCRARCPLDSRIGLFAAGVSNDKRRTSSVSLTVGSLLLSFLLHPTLVHSLETLLSGIETLHSLAFFTLLTNSLFLLAFVTSFFLFSSPL